MAEDAKISVSLLLTTPGDKPGSMDYLLQGREVDKSENLKRDSLFQPGRYPFYWPGSVAIFGGHITSEVDKQVKQYIASSDSVKANQLLESELQREMSEELHQDLSKLNFSDAEPRFYKWNPEIIRNILGEADEVFQGNVRAFLGFDLYSKVPECALNRRDRKDSQFKHLTHMAWICGRTDGDYYLSTTVSPRINFTDYEGIGVVWMPHWAARSIATVPIDKLALLDDMTRKIKSGKLEIKIPQK